MSANPYAPPEAPVADVQPAHTHGEPPFFAVSVTKLVVMSICTLSLYELYWFYRQWKSISARGEDVSPFWRAFFAVFFCYPCFKKIRQHGERLNLPDTLSAGALATGWIVASLMWRLPDPFWWISMATLLFLIPVQSHVNRINEAEAIDFDRNDRFTGWNWVAIVLGGLMLILSVIGTIFPE
jgi:hypothetical protein